MNWFKRSMLVGALASGILFSGCDPAKGPSRSTSSGSLALSSDDALLYAVDTDTGTLNVIDTATDTKIATVKVGDQPGRVAVGGDDTIYVTNRGSNSVSVIRKGEWTEVKQIQVGTEPVGIAVSPDNKMIYVVNSTSADNAEFGTLTGIDVATLNPTFDVQVGAEPRGLALLGNDRAVVTLYKEGELVEVDLTTQKPISNAIGIYDQANASSKTSNNSGFSAFSTFKARALTTVAATNDGTRLFAPVIWAREDPIARKPNSAGGYYSSGGPCNVGAVATAGLVVADRGTGPNGGQLEPQVDDLTACTNSGTNTSDKNYPASTISTGTSGRFGATVVPIQAPVAIAIDPTDTWVFVVNKESSNVAIMPAFRRDPGEENSFQNNGSSVRTTVALNADPNVSSGPDGLALSRDGKRAYVYNQFDHRVDVLGSKGSGSAANIEKLKSITVTSDVLSPEVVVGRKMFFNATDPRLSSPSTNVSCATCHLEGLEDGHVWKFPDGPRQTPALAGRRLRQTQPYHWSGEFADSQAFLTHTIKERMGGTGLVTAKESENLVDFIEALPAPQNANLKLVRTESQLRGAAAFTKANCNSCHAGALLTNLKSEQVGTLVTTGRSFDNGIVITNGIDTPSLLGLARTAPYLHTGTAATLDDRINNNPGDKHGVTSTLSATERVDLIAYLKTL